MIPRDYRVRATITIVAFYLVAMAVVIVVATR